MPEKLIRDASRSLSVTRKRRVTVLASVIRAHQPLNSDACIQYVSLITIKQ
jgi:hypothetical protein